MKMIINEKECHIFKNGTVGPCILCGMGGHSENEVSEAAEKLAELAGGLPYTLLIYLSSDWNAEFSPWAAPAAFGDESFAGKGDQTLKWLRDFAVPYLIQNGMIPPDCKKYLAGYSLSGLFALWAFLREDMFDGAASCSGSLWFPEWMDYMKAAKRTKDGIVYLSLGSKEEKTKNVQMASVGDNTRSSYEWLKKNRCISKTTLEWNKGGHFSEPQVRLAKGIAWLLKRG